MRCLWTTVPMDFYMKVLICSVIKIAKVRGELPMRGFMFHGIGSFWNGLSIFEAKLVQDFFGRNWCISRYTYEEGALWGFIRKKIIGIVCESLETNHFLHESLTFLVEIPVGDKPMKVIIRIFGIGLCELISMEKTWSRLSSSWNNDLLPARKSRFSGRHGSNTLRWTCMKGIRIFGTWGWRKLGTMLMLVQY